MEKSFDIGAIKNFELRIFLERQCSAFLPMSFIVKEKEITVSYYTEGYVSIEEIGLNTPFEMLEIIENILVCLKNAENNLIPLNRFYLRKDCIYFSQKLKRVCLMFKPSNDMTGNKYFACKVEELLRELKVFSSNIRTCEYIDMVIDKLSYSNIGREALINYIVELKREVHICGWR